MEVQIQTGQTKTRGDTTLFAKSLKNQLGEHIFVLLQLEAESLAARTFHKEFLAVVNHALLETEGDAPERVDSTLKELNGLIKGMLLSKTIKDLHAIVGVLTNDGALHVSHAGRAEAYVIRGGTATQITEYSRGKPTPAFVHIASGQLEPRDTVVLSTQRLLRAVTPAQLAQLANRPDAVTTELRSVLEGEKEEAAFVMLHMEASTDGPLLKTSPVDRRTRTRGRTTRSGGSSVSVAAIAGSVRNVFGGLSGFVRSKGVRDKASTAKSWINEFSKDLRHPQRKRRAHMLLVAGVLALFLIIWLVINLTSFSQRSQTKAELKTIIEQAREDLQSAENRRLTGDVDSANSLLQRAQQRSQQVMDDNSGYYRTEALELAGLVRTKREELNNIIRLSPRTLANLSAKKAAITALGMVGLGEEEFMVYDRQDLYRILHNNVEEPTRLSEEELILNGIGFERYQTNVFQTTGNNVVELINGQATVMKTDDPAGWVTGKDIETYLRFLYVLSPENNQIYKYERMSNRYAAPDAYNVNGDLAGALDMAIDGDVFVLKENGVVVKLFRGEQQQFTLLHGPDDVLKNATKLFKVTDGNLYFLDPVQSRVIVTSDGDTTGEASYMKQYVLEGDEIGELKDLWVDAEQSHLYVLDEKKLYVVDLTP